MRGKSMTWEEIKEYAVLHPREVTSKPEMEDLSLVLVENAGKIENGKKFKEVWPRSAKEGMNTRLEQKQSDTNDQGMAVRCWFCGRDGNLARECRYRNRL